MHLMLLRLVLGIEKKRKRHTMEDQKELGVRTKAQKLAAEIYQIYDELRAIIPDVHHRVGSAEPGWIPLEPGSKATIRDYILRDYAQVQHSRKKAPLEIKQQAMACPLSFDVTSNPYIFDIDHFHSRAHLMTELTKLEDDQILLRDIKNELQRKGLSNRVLNKLIPTSREQLKVTGLRNIYYNYPKNLWPLSGPVNSAKQDKFPLKYASQTTLDAMHIFANEEDFDFLLTNIKTEFEVDSPEFDELQRKRKEEFLCDRLSRAFDESCEKTSILPCVIEDGNYTCELEFFKGTILGQTAISYCGARAELTLKSLDITTKCLRNKPQLRPGIQATFRCLSSVIDESIAVSPLRKVSIRLMPNL